MTAPSRPTSARALITHLETLAYENKQRALHARPRSSYQAIEQAKASAYWEAKRLVEVFLSDTFPSLITEAAMRADTDSDCSIGVYAMCAELKELLK